MQTMVDGRVILKLWDFEIGRRCCWSWSSSTADSRSLKPGALPHGAVVSVNYRLGCLWIRVDS